MAHAEGLVDAHAKCSGDSRRAVLLPSNCLDCATALRATFHRVEDFTLKGSTGILGGSGRLPMAFDCTEAGTRLVVDISMVGGAVL